MNGVNQHYEIDGYKKICFEQHYNVRDLWNDIGHIASGHSHGLSFERYFHHHGNCDDFE